MARPEHTANGARGLALAKQGRLEEALASLDAGEAIDRDPEALNTRGMILTNLGRLDEAEAEFGRALALRPDFPDAINNCGTVHARRGHFEEARTCYERSLALAPAQVHTRYNLSTTLLALGQWERGFREFESRWKLFPQEAVRRNRLAPVWTGAEEEVRGKTVLLHHEQGYGDALQFCRYAPLVARRGTRVILAVPRALRELMETLAGGVEIVADGDTMPAHDYCCALMSLPRVFGTTPDNAPADVPYLRANPRRVEEWRWRLGPHSRARIGLVWSGRRYPPINHPRDVPLETVLPLLGLQADFIVLQQGLTLDERERLAGYSNVSLRGEGLEDFADTAALVEQLDLVITVDTAVAHLAGAMGKPVWLMNRFASCWRWLLERTDSPWYPTMRLFRQRSLGDWKGVVEEVQGAGEALIAALPVAGAKSDRSEASGPATRRRAMLRILLTWELGLNFGHLARLLPVAAELKRRGHAVLVAARDLTTAAQVLAPAGISFVQAPHLAQGHPLPHRASGYSDILRAQGWGDVATLRGITEGWINLYRMFRPDLVVADYSPTAILATHIARRPHLLIGNGFELPPAAAPLPPFPGFSWATAEQAADSEAFVLENAGRVARAFRSTKLDALRALVSPARALFATWPELDHYGPRDGARYIGPLLANFGGPAFAWPSEKRAKKVFACVRPDTEHAADILSALKTLDANVVCVAPGFSDAQLAPHAAPNVAFSRGLVDLSRLTAEADLCLSYGAEGTVSAFLLAGVPQIIAPRQVEAFMAIRRIETLGAGLALRGSQSSETVKQAIETVLTKGNFAQSARRLGDRYSGEAGHSVEHAVAEIEREVRGNEESAAARVTSSQRLQVRSE